MQTSLTLAQTAADRNWQANLAALELSLQGLTDLVVDAEWVFARDGSLTARLDNSWWSGCSLPGRAAESVLRRLELTAQVACFVAPTHPAQLRFALARMTAGQALIALVPDARDLRIGLACEDFSAEIRAGRLWFVTGDAWAADLAALLAEHEGLPALSQLVRTNLVDPETADALMSATDAVIQKENVRRADLVRSILSQHTTKHAVLAVVASQFRLWDDAGESLRQVAATAGWTILDVDDPRTASPVAFARHAANARTIVIPNASRAQLPTSLSPDVRVLSWLTTPRIPPFDPKHALDGLLLTDQSWREPATRAGWPQRRVQIAHWPLRESPSAAGRGLALIADAFPIRPPDFDLSSHGVLWQSIAAQISKDPFLVPPDPAAFLSGWCTKVGIDEHTLDRKLFLDRLIVPAYQQALAKLLVKEGIDLRIFGRGWDQVDALADRHAGEIRGRTDLLEAVDSAAALVHAWPTPWVHPIDAMARPVLKPAGSKFQWLQDARLLSRGQNVRHNPSPPHMPLTASTIESLSHPA